MQALHNIRKRGSRRRKRDSNCVKYVRKMFAAIEAFPDQQLIRDFIAACERCVRVSRGNKNARRHRADLRGRLIAGMGELTAFYISQHVTVLRAGLYRD